jgi:hypothetical protein
MAATGVAPVGNRAVPLRVNPQLPATVSVEQIAAWAADVTPKNNIAIDKAARTARVGLRVMVFSPEC